MVTGEILSEVKQARIDEGRRRGELEGKRCTWGEVEG